MYSFLRNNFKRTARAARHWGSSLTDLRPKVVVLAYHRILPEAVADPLHMIVTIRTFIKQLDALARRYAIISLTDTLGQGTLSGANSKIKVVLSFDDGYRDIYDFVFPVLKKKGLCGSFFLPTDYIGKDNPLWDWELMALLSRAKDIKNININGEVFNKRLLQSNCSFILHILEKIKSFDPEARIKVMDSLRSRINVKLESDYQDNRCITWQEAGKMSEAGMEMGSHGASHSSMARIPFKDAEAEVIISKNIIEQNINKPCCHFAFPFGSKRDYNQPLVDFVRDAGFKTCLLNIHGYNYPENNNFYFKRIIMEESTSISCILG